jgi:hypothetical protein
MDLKGIITRDHNEQRDPKSTELSGGLNLKKVETMIAAMMVPRMSSPSHKTRSWLWGL